MLSTGFTECWLLTLRLGRPVFNPGPSPRMYIIPSLSLMGSSDLPMIR
uniref:Uncharacterized protein n=1 Tax=Anguilla anguilla TaxID=7936 RepID=A0A0E9RS18_ANGAN